MAKNMPNPWIRNAVLRSIDEISDYKQHYQLGRDNRAAKITQVIGVIPEANMVIVNDRLNSACAVLTPSCVAELKNKNKGISDLRGFFISLRSWSLSSMIVCAGDRDLSTFPALKISFPIGIQVTSLMPLGGDGCTMLGSPVDINRDPKIKTALSGMTHLTMVERLTKSQFRNQVWLPDASGEFCVPPAYGLDNPLRLEDAKIPPDQEKEMDLVDSYDCDSDLYSQEILRSQEILTARQMQLTMQTEDNGTQQDFTQRDEETLVETLLDNEVTRGTYSIEFLDDFSQIPATQPPIPAGTNVLELESWAYSQKAGPFRVVGNFYINRRVRKWFTSRGFYDGTVVGLSHRLLYKVLYDDGDWEEMDEDGILLYLLPEVSEPPVSSSSSSSAAGGKVKSAMNGGEEQETTVTLRRGRSRDPTGQLQGQQQHTVSENRICVLAGFNVHGELRTKLVDATSDLDYFSAMKYLETKSAEQLAITSTLAMTSVRSDNTVRRLKGKSKPKITTVSSSKRSPTAVVPSAKSTRTSSIAAFGSIADFVKSKRAKLG